MPSAWSLALGSRLITFAQLVALFAFVRFAITLRAISIELASMNLVSLALLAAIASFVPMFLNFD